LSIIPKTFGVFEKKSSKNLDGIKKCSTFAPAFAQKHGFEALKKEFFERFT
jgi:hypothetical protein